MTPDVANPKAEYMERNSKPIVANRKSKRMEMKQKTAQHVTEHVTWLQGMLGAMLHFRQL